MQHFQKRDIFGYSDGEKTRWADPLTVLRRLTQASGGNPNRLLDQARRLPPEGDPEQGIPDPDPMAVLQATEAADRLVEACRAAFGLPPIDPDTGEGVPEQVVWDALEAYLAFCDAKKKPSASGPTCSPPTADSASEDRAH